MADYRDWCGSCHNEINFGGHDPDCDYLHAQHIARKEQREFTDAVREEYEAKTDEELIVESSELLNDIEALSALLRAKERKWDFLYRDIIMYDRRDVVKKLKDRFGLRIL